MRRRLAAVAVVVGAIWTAPAAIGLTILWATLVGLLPLSYEAPDDLDDGLQNLAMVSSALIAPSLLMWGLIVIQRTELGRARVLARTFFAFVFTMPFLVGLLAVLPLMFFGMVPLMRSLRGASPDKCKPEAILRDGSPRTRADLG